jgi:hypothetical protein
VRGSLIDKQTPKPIYRINFAGDIALRGNTSCPQTARVIGELMNRAITFLRRKAMRLRKFPAIQHRIYWFCRFVQIAMLHRMANFVGAQMINLFDVLHQSAISSNKIYI